VSYETAPGGVGALYEGWAAHQERLVACLRPLTDEQLALRPSREHWAVWQLASNIVGGRAHWFHEVLGEGDPSIRDMFRVTSPTVPGLPLEDAGWEDDENHPRTAAELAGAFEATWELIDGCLRRWSADDLAVEFVREYGGRRRVVSRGWVIWHVMEHDLQHGTEIALILRQHGLPTLDI
jgi:uncharacterized damage-inducible protein DinB